MIALRDSSALKFFTPCVVALVTVEVKNLNKDDFDGYYGSMALNKVIFGRVKARE